MCLLGRTIYVLKRDLERLHMASRAPVHQNLKPETSCQHSTFGGAPSEFDFFDLPVKQQDETLVDAEMYTSTLTLKSFI